MSQQAKIPLHFTRGETCDKLFAMRCCADRAPGGVIMDLPLTIQPIEKYIVVEFRTASLMDPVQLENISAAIYRLVDVEDHRQIVLDFEKVQYLSSQALGMLMAIRKKLTPLPHSCLVLCGVGTKLMELIKITRLDKLLNIKPSQKEAVKVPIP